MLHKHLERGFECVGGTRRGFCHQCMEEYGIYCRLHNTLSSRVDQKRTVHSCPQSKVLGHGGGQIKLMAYSEKCC